MLSAKCFRMRGTCDYKQLEFFGFFLFLSNLSKPTANLLNYCLYILSTLKVAKGYSGGGGGGVVDFVCEVENCNIEFAAADWQY